MTLDIAGAIDISAHVPRTGHAFGIGAPSLAALFQIANDVVGIDMLGAEIAEAAFIEGLAGSHLKIIADGRMGVGVKGGGDAVFGGQPVQERHVGIADDATEVLIFLDHKENVIYPGYLCARGAGAKQEHERGRSIYSSPAGPSFT